MQVTRLPRVSVVVATYNRLPLISRLVRQLAEQTLGHEDYELLVIDDGSAEPARPVLEALALPLALRVERQENAGAAAARHRGVMAARGEIVVILDDDMQVSRDYLEQHLRAHPPGSRRAVLGALHPPPDVEQMPLFARWHQNSLEKFGAAASSGQLRLRGDFVYTGNVSFRREDYLAIGGFDPDLATSEDTELGLRLEKSGVEIAFSQDAYTVNCSDHTSLEKWRKLNERYAVHDVLIARKHPDLRYASPWRYLEVLPRAVSPLLVASSLVPPAGRFMGGVVYRLASVADRLGRSKAAFAATGLTRCLDYFVGLRSEMGALPMLMDIMRFLRKPPAAGGPARASRALLKRWLADIRADHRILTTYDAKYGQNTTKGHLRKDVVNKIGLQMMIGIRTMRLFRDAGFTLGAKAVSRAMRHAYGSDIHWDAEFEPGVVISHGMAIAIAGGAYISSGCILSHGVTIGKGIDPATRKVGVPRLEKNVHLGPHSILIGPITVGESSKVQPGAFLTRSVPPRSMVATPEPEVRARKGGDLKMAAGEAGLKATKVAQGT